MPPAEFNVSFLKDVEIIFINELLTKYRNITYLTEGGYKRVYRATDEKGKNIVIGVSVPDKNYLQNYRNIMRILGNEDYFFLKSNLYESTLTSEDVEKYNLHLSEITKKTLDKYIDYMINSRGLPLFFYEVSKMYEMNLENYFKNVNWSWNDFKIIFCQILHGLRFLHSKGVAFTDFKLKNTLINTQTMEVMLIDFLDSPTGCNLKKCLHESNARTYYNVFENEVTIRQDLWRIGFCFCKAIEYRYSEFIRGNISSIVGNSRDEINNCSDSKKCIAKLSEEYKNKLEIYLFNLFNFLKNYNLSRISAEDGQLLFRLIKTLLGNPEKRPIVKHILRSPFFVDTCFSKKCVSNKCSYSVKRKYVSSRSKNSFSSSKKTIRQIIL